MSEQKKQQSQDDVPFQYDAFRDSQATLEAVHLPWKTFIGGEQIQIKASPIDRIYSSQF